VTIESKGVEEWDLRTRGRALELGRCIAGEGKAETSFAGENARALSLASASFTNLRDFLAAPNGDAGLIVHWLRSLDTDR